VSQGKRNTDVRRETGQEQPEERAGSAMDADPETRAGMRRFSPSRRTVTEGGSVFGTLVANERARLGLSQSELATMIEASPSTIARIEAGHSPTDEIRKQLAVALSSEPPRRARRRVPAVPSRPQLRVPRPRLRLGPRWFWAGLAVVNILIALALGGRLSGNGSSSASPLQPSDVVSNRPEALALAASHRERTRAENAAAAEARQAAKRKREAAAAAAAEAAAARKAAAKVADQGTTTVAPPITEPIAPSPAPSGGGGGGGGSSGGPAPELQHGIGTQGG
jgi:transcriptional regulator with XRE-family HTH domain